jgi:hypothetical protein
MHTTEQLAKIQSAMFLRVSSPQPKRKKRVERDVWPLHAQAKILGVALCALRTALSLPSNL